MVRTGLPPNRGRHGRRPPGSLRVPASAKVFDEMADEEVTHRTRLFDLYRQKFGEYLPLIRRQDVQGLRPAQVDRCG